MMTRLSSIAVPLAATLQGLDVPFERVTTDTRQVRSGDLFVALKGDNFDGHDFVARAREQGAVAALVSRPLPDAISQLVVQDTLTGLQALGAHWRQQFELPVVGVTGSNGKTTTKQMLASIFEARGPVLATQGNLNNHIGVPLTLLSLRAEHRTAVVEMGANHAGEIELLTRLARPQVGVVTQAGDAHLEGFGSREGVARAKGELFAGLAAGGIAVINHDDAYAPLWRGLAASHPIIHFGMTERADVHALQVEVQGEGMRFDLNTPSGRAAVNLPLPGRHNVANALAAAACGIALGMDVEDIAAGLSRMKNAAGRLAWARTPQGARLLDDTYNANPTSLHAAMELLAGLPGERLLIIGGMAELGPDAAKLHADAGTQARRLGIQRLMTLGPLAAEAGRAFGPGAEHFEDVNALSERARVLLHPDMAVLVKGSRSARMERVVTALTGTATAGGH